MTKVKFGSAFNQFIQSQNLSPESQELLSSISSRIIERTELLDGNPSSNCQLVIGEVQSGKTMSFTSLIALAHDNGFPLVIVLAGTKNQLLSQTHERLKRDLKADGDGGANPWVLMEKFTKSKRAENIRKVQKSLNIWLEKNAPADFKPTVVITTLKNRTSLDEITEVITSQTTPINVAEFPVLIVDDEGDQAGLNLNWNSGQDSPIYAAISRLRKSLPKHSYVMYTATPQGPLLIGIQDALSPKFVTLLKSGPDYLGGQELFQNNENFIKIIPEVERTGILATNKDAPIPQSLKHSIAFFLLALYVAQKRAYPKPISMLVHPSAKIELHEIFGNWVETVLDSWQAILEDQSEKTYQIERDSIFKPAEVELKKTVNLGEDWNLDKVLEDIRWWISKVEVRLINSKNKIIKPEDWKSKAGWIVIGGNNLERGFTIENLAVTYMPRSLGSRNVDVIQQRGRFFGYKRKYMDLLRGWFFPENARAYEDYIAHEQSIRSQLAEYDKNGEDLANWRRRFLLDPAYSPVRQQVVALQIIHNRLSIFKQHKLYEPALATAATPFLSKIYSLATKLHPMPNDLRIDYRNHYSDISIDAALELLADWPLARENRSELDDVIWALKALAETNVLTTAVVVLMDWNPSIGEQRIRERSMLKDKPNPELPPEDQSIANIFQGRTSKSDGNYPGDAEMKFPNKLTIQVHRVRPLIAGTVKPEVVALALLVPENTPGFVTELTDRD